MMDDVTEDWLLNEAVRIFQPHNGYRAGLDAILLAASLRANPQMRGLEVGCGAGGALFPAAWRLKGVQFTGVEREADMAALARRGIAANGFEDRVEVITQDICNRPQDWENHYDFVFSNPPYFEAGRIQAPSKAREHAYLADQSLDIWLKHMLFVTRPKGRITLIHRASALGDILTYLLPRSGEIEVFPIHSAPGLPAKRVIVTARKGLRKGEVTLQDGLTMYIKKGDAVYTQEAEAVLNGEAIQWGK